MKLETQAGHPPTIIPERSPRLVLASKPTKNSMVNVPEEIDPTVMISIAFSVALCVSLFLTGLMTAWVYCWQYSGAFTP